MGSPLLVQELQFLYGHGSATARRVLGVLHPASVEVCIIFRCVVCASIDVFSTFDLDPLPFCFAIPFRLNSTFSYPELLFWQELDFDFVCAYVGLCT